MLSSPIPHSPTPLRGCYRRGLKEAVDRFIETVVVGLFLAPFVLFALLLLYAAPLGWVLVVLGVLPEMD